MLRWRLAIGRWRRWVEAEAVMAANAMLQGAEADGFPVLDLAEYRRGVSGAPGGRAPAGKC